MESGSPKIYTRTGDKGKTSLIGGARVSKSNARLEAYGTVDELNSLLGLLAHDIHAELVSRGDQLGREATALVAELAIVQSDLFDLGSQLATEDAQLRAKLPTISSERVTELEKRMDEFSASLKPLKNFILPGGSRAAAVAHVARTVCRRAERLCVALLETEETANDVDPNLVQYLNRLSDYLFVLARHANRLLGIEEPLWLARKG